MEEALPQFRGITSDMVANKEAWRKWISEPRPEETKLPGQWEGPPMSSATKPAPARPDSARQGLSYFGKLLLIKRLRFERMQLGFRKLIEHRLGSHYVSVPAAKLEQVHRDSDAATPVIFVLSAGADPTSILLKFAREKGFHEKLDVISLGQGQGENARRYVEQGKRQGRWVVLQNCHLAKSFMSDLEGIVDGLSDPESSGVGKVHEDFRLWLTSMPAPYFPVSVLQRGIKLTNEPPKGVRLNLQRSFTSVIDASDFETGLSGSLALGETGANVTHRMHKLVFGLAFFHALVQERAKFGPLGWNKRYEFNDSDLETSLQVLRMFLQTSVQTAAAGSAPVLGDVPWDALRTVIGQINYGGRVTDDWDRRTLMAVLGRVYQPSILLDTHRFSQSGKYLAPPVGPLESYLNYVEQLPYADDDEPDVFGMHENANIAAMRHRAASMLSTVLDVQPRSRDAPVAAGGRSSDEMVRDLAREIEEKLPSLIDSKRAAAVISRTDSNGQTDSLAVVLQQEVDRFAQLLQGMRTSLDQIQKAINGEVLTTQELEGMYDDFLSNRVPKLWERLAYPSLKPLASWIRDLHRRIAFLNSWMKNGQPNAFWLSGFFFPQGFLTGVLQRHARQYRVPIDSLAFTFKALDVFDEHNVERPPEDGVYIYGLHLDGACWDAKAGCLDDPAVGQAARELGGFARLPVIHFIPTRQPKYNPRDYVCPVYKTSVREGTLSTTGHSTNFVIACYLPSGHRDPEHWVLRGTALICQTDD